MFKPSVHLIVPGIQYSLSSVEDPSVYKSLQQILKRSDYTQSDTSGYYQTIASQFESDDFDRQMLPVAAVSSYGQSGKLSSDIKMLISPVHIQADKDRLILQGGEILSIQAEETEQLINELNETYQEDQFRFECINHQCWCMTLPQQPDCRFHLLEDALGRSVEPFLPQGNDQLFWHRFLNEVQMLFHTSVVNEMRLENNQIPVNSVWCWGCGQLPRKVATRLNQVVSNEPFVTGLALLAGIKSETLPMRADLLIDHLSEGDCLVAFDLDERDILSIDPMHHQQRLEQLDANWFSPLLNALKKGNIASVRLSDTNGKSYYLKKSHLRRFWRK